MSCSHIASLALAASLAAVAAFAPAAPARAAILTYDAFLSGLGESPPNASPGTALAIVTIDSVANTMIVNVTFSGLLGTTTASHIHCCTAVPDTGTAGVATTVPTFAGFPLGVTSGSYLNTLDLTSAGSYNPAFVTGHGGTASSAEAALEAAMAAGQTYLNIHTTVVPGGEIRGFLALVPEPATWMTMLLGFGLLGATLRRRRITVAA